MTTVDQAIEACREAITKGSKSFSLAARLFPKDTREAAFCLYGWCRRCDDDIDSAGGDKLARLNELKEKTIACYSDRAMTDPVFVAFQFVVKKYAIPRHYPLELLEGMAMDVRGDRYETLDDLKLYCYRVAGTVGLMMTHIMGLSHEKALKNACDLGTAMQLTNIARDIRDDFEMGRIYLPMAWMKEAGLNAQQLMAAESRDALVFLVKRLLGEADTLYRSGDEGLKYLAFGAALPIASARRIYAEIGRRVLARGKFAWDSRTVVSLARKIMVLLHGIVQVVLSIPSRLWAPWKPVPITSLWRFR